MPYKSSGRRPTAPCETTEARHFHLGRPIFTSVCLARPSVHSILMCPVPVPVPQHPFPWQPALVSVGCLSCACKSQDPAPAHTTHGRQPILRALGAYASRMCARQKRLVQDPVLENASLIPVGRPGARRRVKSRVGRRQPSLEAEDLQQSAPVEEELLSYPLPSPSLATCHCAKTSWTPRCGSVSRAPAARISRIISLRILHQQAVEGHQLRGQEAAGEHVQDSGHLLSIASGAEVIVIGMYLPTPKVPLQTQSSVPSQFVARGRRPM